MFAQKELHGTALFGNSEWIVKYQGMPALNHYIEFQRNYYNRILAFPNANDNWVHSLSLEEKERNQLKQLIRGNRLVPNLYQMLASSTKIR